MRIGVFIDTSALSCNRNIRCSPTKEAPYAAAEPFSALSSTGMDSQVLLVLARSEQYPTIPAIHRLLPEEGSSTGVRKALSRLVEQRVVVEQVTGRTHSYALNREHLLADVILKIANAWRELTSRIQDVILRWPVKAVTVKIFGSAARGNAIG